MRSLTITLIVDGLHYCCPWAFFSIFRDTPTIAARLGVDPSTIRRAKASFRRGEMKCEGCERCMKEQVRTIKLVGKKTIGL